VIAAPWASQAAAPAQAPAGSGGGGIQRAPEDDAVAGAAGSQAAGPTGTQAPSPGQSGETNTVELVDQIYPIIRSRLRNDLREDRERAGLMTDLYRRW
jgi:hypothetical protein